jgi:acyl-CoA thioesterase-1
MIAIPFATLMIGCSDGGRNGEAGRDANRDPGEGATNSATSDESFGRDPPGGVPTAEPAGSGGSDAERVVVFLGTSLTAGYGLSPELAFPALIGDRIREAGLSFRVVNAGVSGETSAGALRRIDWLLQQPFDILVVETGANDMLRGIDPRATERNIQEIIDSVRERRPTARIVLAGMLATPNLGADYTTAFEAVYPRLADRNGLTLIPFLLDGVAADRELNQADGIHPNERGQRIVAETVWRALEPVLREMAG